MHDAALEFEGGGEFLGLGGPLHGQQVPPLDLLHPGQPLVGAISYKMFWWVSTTPLGLPVVPEVYSRASGSPGLIAAIRAVISSGSAASRSRPSATRPSQVMYRSPAGHAAGSRTTIFVIPGS